MIAIEVALVGIAVMTAVLAGFFVWLHHRDQVHHFVADHDFVVWADIFRLQGRQFGAHRVGPVRRCYRALAHGIPVELLVETPPAGQGRPHRHRWLLVAQVPRDLAFTHATKGHDGSCPEPMDTWARQTVAVRGVDAVLCGHGLLVVRVTSPAGLEAALLALCRGVVLARELPPDTL